MNLRTLAVTIRLYDIDTAIVAARYALGEKVGAVAERLLTGLEGLAHSKLSATLFVNGVAQPSDKVIDSVAATEFASAKIVLAIRPVARRSP